MYVCTYAAEAAARFQSVHTDYTAFVALSKPLHALSSTECVPA